MTLANERLRGFLNKSIEWSLYAMIFSIPFSKTAIEVSAIVAITCWLCRKALSGKDGFRLPRTELNLPIVIFFTISALSIAWSTHPVVSANALWRKLAEYLLIYFIVFDVASERRVIRNIMVAMSVSVVIVCIDGIFQKLTGHDFIRNYPLHSLERITASFKFPNALSGWFLIVVFPLISIFAFYEKELKRKVLYGALLALMAYCVFFGFTRGAFVSFIIGAVLMLILLGGRISIYAAIAIILAVPLLVIFLPEEVKNNVYVLKLFSGSSTEHRIKVWTAGWRMFLEKPILGQGLNTFMSNYERFRLPGDYGVWYAHNTYLQIAAEIGIFGLISFLWMIVKMFISSVRSWRRIEDRFLRYLFLGLFCGVTSFLVQSNLDVTHYSLQLAVLFYFSLGLLMAVKNVGLKNGKI